MLQEMNMPENDMQHADDIVNWLSVLSLTGARPLHHSLMLVGYRFEKF